MLRNTLGIEITECKWNESIPEGERVGMLFQQTTLLDSLTVAGNVRVALEHRPAAKETESNERQSRAAVKRLLETVGLDYLRDGRKRPSELSGTPADTKAPTAHADDCISRAVHSALVRWNCAAKRT